MQRHSDTDTFYSLLAKLESAVGGTRRLGDCHGRMVWPERGVYFIFEPHEYRSNDQTTLRVVRIGTHALTDGSRTTIWQRLSQHRGSMRSGGGNHRGSIFRLLIGEALMQKNTEWTTSSWGQGSSAAGEIRELEKEHEIRVSDYVADMEILFLPIPDAASPGSLRSVIERNSIALLSNYLTPSPDQPSTSWLGHHSGRDRVRQSGLWNNRHVDEKYDPLFLVTLEQLIAQTSSCRIA